MSLRAGYQIASAFEIASSKLIYCRDNVKSSVLLCYLFIYFTLRIIIFVLGLGNFYFLFYWLRLITLQIIEIVLKRIRIMLQNHLSDVIQYFNSLMWIFFCSFPLVQMNKSSHNKVWLFQGLRRKILFWIKNYSTMYLQNALIFL